VFIELTQISYASFSRKISWSQQTHISRLCFQSNASRLIDFRRTTDSRKEKRMTKPYVRLDKNDAAVLLVDHQAGLLSLVRDIEPDKFKNNVLALGDLAKYFNLPTILTTSFETGPNGPLVPELKAQFPDTPYIARPGNINAWDNEDFVKAVKATGKKQLIIAGVVTEVCVAFPALSAIEEGFDVFVVTDASGTFNEITRHSAWDR